MPKYGDTLLAIRRDEAAIARAAVQQIQDDHRAGQTADDPFLNEPVCGMISKVARKYLERSCKGDEDEEFFAKEDQIQNNVLKFIQQGIDLKAAQYGL